MRFLFNCCVLLAFAAVAAGYCAIADRLPVRTKKTTALRGRASWYGEGYRGKTMANGQPFFPDAMTCAAWEWPLGTMLLVTHEASGRFVVVEVTDRGPAPWTRCIIDLSARAFQRLASPDLGKIEVAISVLRLGPEAQP